MFHQMSTPCIAFPFQVLLNMAVKEVKAKEVIVQAKGSQVLSLSLLLLFFFMLCYVIFYYIMLYYIFVQAKGSQVLPLSLFCCDVLILYCVYIILCYVMLSYITKSV
jgi:hypothetical protein